MNPSMSNDLAHDFSPLLKGTSIVPPSINPQTGVQSRDVVISHEAAAISARLYIPKSTIDTNTPKKLPLLLYFHGIGGGFSIDTAFSPTYHNYLNSLVAEANVVAVSVDYRRVPEHPLPIAFHDSWAALKWVGSHFDGNGPEEWLNGYADLERILLAGDSTGANIAHHMALQVGFEGLVGVKLIGIVLVHPYFWGTEPIGEEHQTMPKRENVDALWRFAYPLTSGSDDPLINPGKDPKLGGLGCEKVLVCVAEKDFLKDRGWYYSELLRKSGWGETVEVWEAKGEDHVFHLFNPNCDNAVAMLKKMASFFN